MNRKVPGTRSGPVARSFTATVLVSGVFLAGCTASAAGGDDTRDSAEGTRSAAALLPVEAYLISPAEDALIGKARTALIAQCVSRFRLTLPQGYGDHPLKSNQTVHRYDPTEPAEAARNGYHAPLPDGPARKRERLSKELRTVLGDGLHAPGPEPTASSFRGHPIPKGGCTGEADARLVDGGGALQDAPVAVNVNFDSYRRALNDARLRRAFADWSRCMKTEGYMYDTPLAAVNDPAWKSPAPSVRERHIAEQDAHCKRSEGVVDTWFDVESAYQRRDITTHGKQLRQARERLDITLDNAAQVVGGSH